MSTGPRDTTQTSRVELTPDQKAILGYAMPGVREFSAKVPERYPGSLVAQPNATQQAAQGIALGGAGNQANLAASGAGAADYFLGGDVWDAGGPSAMETVQGFQKPNVDEAIRAAVRPVNEQLTETTLPAIGDEAMSHGQYGGSRQGIAQGIASREAGRTAGDIGTKIATQMYGTNLDATLKAQGLDQQRTQSTNDAMLKALGLLPTVQGAQVQPAVTVGGVGDVQNAYNQALLNERGQNFNYDQWAPFLQAQELIGLVNGIPGATTIATGQNPRPGIAQGLGGAAAGASLGTAIMPGFGTAAGAGIGALLPFLMG